MEPKKIKVVACSGASNTGAYTDLTARKLMKKGEASMLCLTRFSIDEKFADTLKAKNENITVLDGCDINCGEKILRKAGIQNLKHIIITDFGIEKGKTQVTDEKVNEIIESILTSV